MLLFRRFDFTLYIPCPGDGMPIANFCNSSMTLFNDTYSFLPGENVTITCSVPSTGVLWQSSQLVDLAGTMVGATYTVVGKTDKALDGAITVSLTNQITDPLPQLCATSTATITNIQEEPFQDLDLTCTNFALLGSTLNIDVISK